MKLGGHIGGFEGDLTDLAKIAVARGYTFFQIFFGDSSKYDVRYKPSKEEIKSFTTFMQKHEMRFSSHFPYKLNLCWPNAAMNCVQIELSRVAAIGGRVVLHVGSFTDNKYDNRSIAPLLAKEKSDLTEDQQTKVKVWTKGWQTGMDLVIENLNKLSYPDNITYPLLLEPPAGEGKKLGWSKRQLKYLFDRAPQGVGLCLDTCHSFAAGTCRYDTADGVDSFMKQVGEAIGGIQKLKLIHLNDSSDTFGAMKDHHAVLGQGNIWGDPEQMPGLIKLFEICKEHEIDMVSECGTTEDFELMKAINDSL
ncbi:MAG: TIM barrel protein [Candidatus Roizmanbacteria bacterium]